LVLLVWYFWYRYLCKERFNRQGRQGDISINSGALCDGQLVWEAVQWIVPRVFNIKLHNMDKQYPLALLAFLAVRNF